MIARTSMVSDHREGSSQYLSEMVLPPLASTAHSPHISIAMFPGLSIILAAPATLVGPFAMTSRRDNLILFSLERLRFLIHDITCTLTQEDIGVIVLELSPTLTLKLGCLRVNQKQGRIHRQYHVISPTNARVAWQRWPFAKQKIRNQR